MALINAPMKRVACLYRVSTKGQLLGDDIPTQRRSCMEFIERQPGWVFVKEYIEGGVSGFKVSANNRDEIQRAKADAEKGEFDVLLVFMFDRLGRRDDETPFVLKWFVQQGIEMWSVSEGQQKFEDHTDDLINYLRFWQSSGESKKTSMRVTENHNQMGEDGLFSGGTAPYGYQLVPSGVYNKKRKELLKRAIEPDTAAIVDELYSYAEYMGSNRIAKHMNEVRDPFIPSPTGGQWTSGVINYILRNPIYKGYPAIGKRRSKMGVFAMQNPSEWILAKEQVPELVIIQEDRWDRVQMMRSSKSPKKKSGEERGYHINISKSPLLFVGMINCGHCGAPLTTTYNRKKYNLADGTEVVQNYPKYRCSGKAMGKTCGGQTLYSQSRIETVVLDEIDIYLDQLKQVDFTAHINSFQKQNVAGDKKEQKKIASELEKKRKEVEVLTGEVTKSIMGQSSFKPELLNSLIEKANAELNELETAYQRAAAKIAEKQVEVQEMEMLRKHIPVWKEVFKSSPIEKQKMMLAAIIDGVIVKRDDIEINVKLHISHFTSFGSETASRGRAHRWQR